MESHRVYSPYIKSGFMPKSRRLKLNELSGISAGVLSHIALFRFFVLLVICLFSLSSDFVFYVHVCVSYFLLFVYLRERERDRGEHQVGWRVWVEYTIKLRV